MATFYLILDLAGTFVFALSGATVGVGRKLDLFGVMVLSFVAGNTGGIIRDVVIGAIPPAALDDWRYIAVCMLAGVITFYRYRLINRLRSPVLICDGMGLGLFAVSGADKALAYHLNPVAAVILGMLSGIGGGMARDILTAEIPVVLRTDFYAVAALAGASVVVIGHKLQLPSGVDGMAGAILCFVLRFLAIRRAWQLPTSPETEPSPSSSPNQPPGS